MNIFCYFDGLLQCKFVFSPCPGMEKPPFFKTQDLRKSLKLCFQKLMNKASKMNFRFHVKPSEREAANFISSGHIKRAKKLCDFL